MRPVHSVLSVLVVALVELVLELAFVRAYLPANYSQIPAKQKTPAYYEEAREKTKSREV